MFDLGGGCELLLYILSHGHYTLSTRADVDDPAFQVGA